MSGKGLVIDDILHTISEIRLHFGLAKIEGPSIQVESHNAGMLRRLIGDVIELHNATVYAKKQSLINRLGPHIFQRRVRTGAYSGYRLHPDTLADVLRLVLLTCLETITQLPVRDDRFNPRGAKSLGRRLTKLTENLNNELASVDLHKYFGPDVDKARLLKLPDEIAYAGHVLAHLPAKPPATRRISSRNPQVRLALYLAGWVEAASGSQRYEILQQLIDAAFEATNKRTPAWASRLAIEMHRQRRDRKEWIGRLSRQ